MVQTTSHIFSGKVDIESNLLVGSSHLFVDTTNNRVGITTVDPDASLHVNGNAYVESNVGVGSNIKLDGDTGIITATGFVGDASQLTGLASNLEQVVNNGNVTSNTIQFINTGTSLTASGNVVIDGNVTSTTALISNVATIGTTKTFVITVGGNGKYHIDGVDRPLLELHEHQTYIFDFSSSTLLGHPFIFSETANGGAYTSGITTTGTYGSDQIRTFIVPANAPTTLYYYCTNHINMGATVSISPTAELIVSGRVVASGNVEASTFIGDGSQLTGVVTSISLQDATDAGNTTTETAQFTNTGTSLTASGSIAVSGGVNAAYLTGDGSNVNIGQMTAETVPYVDSNKQLRDSHITRTANKTIITSNLEVIGNVITQNNITVGAQGSYYGDGTTLTGVALSTDLSDNVIRIGNLSTDLSDNVIRIGNLETATIISNSSTITTGFTKGDIIYASDDNVLNKLAVGGTDGHVLKVTNAANKTLGWGVETGGTGMSQWNTVNTNEIHYSGGNVGINVSDPAFKLDVHGTANVGALTATSLSVGGQALALEADLTANASRVDSIYSGSVGDIIYVDATNSLAKRAIGAQGDVLKVSAGGIPVWDGEPDVSSQWSNVTVDEVYFDGNVGISNTNPGHDLSVGSNLFVDDDGSNVLVISGNAAMTALTLGEVSIVASHGLGDILNASNTSPNTMELTNATTGLVATGNVHALKFIGDGSELTNATTGLVATGNVHALKFIGDGSELTSIASNLDQIVNNGNVTSNTVQFSNATTGLVTTANVEVGGELTVSGNATVSENLTVSGNVSDLNVVSNVNMLHTANTAAIKLNSNVVTEFPRSKKLIKYPRVLLTSAALNSAYENGYKVTFSHEHGSQRAYYPFSAVDGGGWHSNPGGGGREYNGTGGVYSGTTRLATETEKGEWLGLELPEAIKLQKVKMASQNFDATVNTIDNFIIYAKKQSGDTWTHLGTFVDMAASQDSPDGVMVNVDTVEYYKFFAVVATKRYAAGTNNGVSIRVLEYFGIPEYDPDAHGTEVVIKSLPNVPNTDWLEVYYDANNYSGSGDVQDETANNRDGTIDGVVYDSVSKSFTFDGVNDKIDHGPMSFTPSDATSGYTASLWFKVPKINYVGTSYATGSASLQGGNAVGGLLSKGLTGTQGFTFFNSSNPVTKDMTSGGAQAIPSSSNPSSSSLTPSGTGFFWNDWTNDIFDSWGYWYIYNPASGNASYIQFGTLNGSDGTVYTETQTHHSKTFTIKHGWVASGIFKLDIECDDPTFQFAIGSYGNMGSDSTTFNEDRQYTASWGTLNYNFNGDHPTTATDPIFSFFIPKETVFNEGITLSGNNFTSNWTTLVVDNDKMGHFSSTLKLGAILYYVKAGNTSFPQANFSMAEWVANDINITGSTQELFHFGHGSRGESFGMNVANGNVGMWEWGGDKSKQTSSNLYTNNEWVHATGTIYNDPVTGHGYTKIFVNGELRPESVQRGILPNLAIPTNPYLTLGTSFIGERTSYSTQHFKGSIANFRLFNRVLSSDEIYQLYAYQKEYFGHGNLSMTLKAGRLGIGTSEPRAALDVRGDIYGGCPVFFTAYSGGGSGNYLTGSSSGTIIVFNNTSVNKGGAYDTSNGRCTFPISGYYEVFFRGATASTVAFHGKIYKNGSAPGSGDWPDNIMRVYDDSGGQFRNAGTIQFIYYFKAEEYIEVRLNSGVFNGDNYNSFSVKYLSN